MVRRFRWSQFRVEALESRVTPAVVGPLQPHTQTEVSAFMRGDQPLTRLGQWATQNRVDGIDLARTRIILTNEEGALLSVGVSSGVTPIAVLDVLDESGIVSWVEPNYIFVGDGRDYTPNDPQYGAQYHHTLMQNNLAWDTETGEASIVIAVTDDGVGYNHPDLVANMYLNPDDQAKNGLDGDSNGFIDDTLGWDFNDNDNTPLPGGSSTHGTHVSGIMAATTNNGIGVAGTAGGGNGKGGGIRVQAIRWDGSNGWTAQRVADSFTYAANNDAKIVNSSYNFDGWVNNATVTTAWDYSYGKGVLHINSAGNTGTQDPARKVFTYPLFVANTNASDKRSGTSSYGSYVDISAPGDGILSTTTSASGTGVNYQNFSGTSMAAPNAAAVAGLIWSANPTWTREQVVARLLASADPIDSLNPGFEGLLGTGRANSNKALNSFTPPPKLGTTTLPSEGATVGAFTEFTIVTPMRFNPATVNTTNFELRRNGVDNVFDTADDKVFSLTINDAAPYRVGTNELKFKIAGTLSPDTYRFTAKTTLTDPFGQFIDGNGDGKGGDAFVRSFKIAGVEAAATGRVFEDRDNDGVIDAGEVGLVNWQVIDDDDGDGVHDSGTANTSPISLPVAIPDVTTTNVPIFVATAPGYVTDVNINLSITHTYDADLDVYLTSPSGAKVTLFEDVGGSGQNFTNTTLDDEAVTLISAGAAPFTGSFKPAGLLSAFDGAIANGTWTLTIIDDAGGDFGSLTACTLTIGYAEAQTFTLSDGSYVLPGLTSGTHSIRRVEQAGWNVGLPSAHVITLDEADSVVTDRNFGVTHEGGIYGQAYNDADANNRRTANEQRWAGVTTYLDINGNNVLDAGTTVKSTSVPVAIPAATTQSSTLSVAGFVGNITDIDVKVNITHTWNADLSISLKAPNGVTIDLSSGNGGSTDNYADTVFDDRGFGTAAVAPAAGPFTMRLRPEQALSAFNGISPNGTWTLIVADAVSADSGTLNSWGITINGEPVEVTDAQGTYRYNLAAGSYSVRAVTPGGMTATQPAGGTYPVTVTATNTTPSRDFGFSSNADLTGAFYADDSGGGAFSPGEPGLPGWTVWSDIDNDGVLDTGGGTFVAIDTGGKLQDGFTTFANLTVSGLTALVSDVNVKFSAPHSYTGDLDVFLLGPDGTRVDLALNRGGSGDNYTDTVFDDQATTLIAAGAAPFTGSFKPDGSLADFNGSDPNGVWRLGVTDEVAGDFGSITAFELSITTAEPSRVSDAAGKYLFDNVNHGSYTLRRQSLPGWLTVEPTDGDHTATFAGATTITRNFGQYQPVTVNGRVYADANANFQRDAGELGVAGVTVFLDNNFNNVIDASTTTVNSTNVPVNIVDEGTVTSTISLSGFSNIVDVNVKLNLNHTWVDDLDIFLISPSGVRVELVTDVGSSDDNFIDTVFDDEAGVAITAGVAPYTGSFRPEGLLSVLDGSLPVGAWTLEISDDVGSDVGVLNSWSLTVVTGDPVTVTDANGDYSFTNMSPDNTGGYQVRIVAPGGVTQTENGGVNGPRHLYPETGETYAGVEFGLATPNTINAIVYGDTNANFNRNVGETGLPGATVYIDRDGNHRFDSATKTVASGAGPLAITGLNTVTSALTVSGVPNLLTDVNVKLSIAHAINSDVDVFLISPSGTRVELVTDAGGVNYTGTVFDDQAVTLITAGAAPYTGSFRPEGRLADFNGQSANGTWLLEIRDDVFSTDGSLTAWEITFTSGDPSTVTDAAGAYSFTGLGNGVHNVRLVNLPGYELTQPADGVHSPNFTGNEVKTGQEFGQFKQTSVSGKVYADANYNATLDGLEAGLPGVVVFHDANGNGLLDQTGTTVSSTDVPVATVNEGSVYSRIKVAGFSGVLNDVNVKVNINHGFLNVVSLFLIAPNGARIELSSDNGPTGASGYADTVFDDQAGTLITAGTAPFTGSFRPEGSLAALNGFKANGEWLLEVNDADGFNDVGSINSWSLTLTGGERSVTTDASGLYTLGRMGAGLVNIRQVLPSGAFQTEPTANAPQSVTLVEADAITGRNFGQATAGKVAAVVVNNGVTQRSVVTSVRVEFDSKVAFVGGDGNAAAAFTLKRNSDAANVTLSAAVDNSGPTTKVTLTFTGGAVNSISLQDGRYTLSAVAANFVSGLDGNNDGVVGDDYQLVGDTTNTLFRLFGDADGSGQVTSADFLAFRLAFLSPSATFDFNNNGTVDAADFIQFRLRFLQSV